MRLEWKSLDGVTALKGVNVHLRFSTRGNALVSWVLCLTTFLRKQHARDGDAYTTNRGCNWNRFYFYLILQVHTAFVPVGCCCCCRGLHVDVLLVEQRHRPAANERTPLVYVYRA